MKMMRLILTLAIATCGLTPGSGQWKISTSGPTANLFEVDFPAAGAAYATADMGMLFKSIDKGVSWNLVHDFGPFTSFGSLDFINADTGIVNVNGAPTLTFDGGSTWAFLPGKWWQAPGSVKFTGERLYTSYVSNDTAYFMKSDDFGTTVTEVFRHYEASAQPFVFSFVDNLNGFLINPNELEQVLKTTDGGQTFDTLTITNGPMVLQDKFDFIDSQYGYHYGSYGSQSHPTRTWNTGTFYFPVDLDGFGVLPVFDLDWKTSRLYAGSLYGKIFYSLNHGQNWIEQSTPGTDPVYSVAFLNENEGIAAMGRDILYTNNGGMLGMKESGIGQPQIQLFPNPARDYITINIPKGIQIEAIVLLDLQGRKLRTFEKASENLDLEGLARGQYILQFASSKGIVNKEVTLQ